MRIVMWISVLLLSEMCKSYSEVVHQPDPVMMVSVGDTVTLRCFFLVDHNDPVTWYKQTSGQQPQAVAMVQKLVKTAHFFDNFKSSRFSIESGAEKCHLTISNVTPSDEAVYYCGWRKYETYFAGGTYLALKGSQNNPHESLVSVLQHPESEPVQFGDPVTLQCSVLYEHNTTDIRMFWFRSDSGKAVPEIIYTPNQCESNSSRSCTFRMSKNISSQMDTGTYYCAVATCGKILFGNGTKINMVKPVDPLVIILGVLLGICVIVITAQAVLSHKKDKEKRQQDIEREHPSSQDHDEVELSYAALYFKEGKNRRVRRKGETPQDSVYSPISNPSKTDHNVVEYRRSQNNLYEFRVTVLQHPESEPVQFGDTVNLQCSVLYEHSTTDIRMFWFRSDSGKAVPEIIYTPNQCESNSTRSCTFRMSKSISSQIDTGTYYCAVATCGKILFGNGTKINMIKPVDPLVILLGVLLGVCVVAITAQAVLSHEKEIYYNNKARD
ncbi:novel immune-type receptor 13 [Garra rufa]|uniref:novel immune-type receptor 13 n=1 Tax=Garra rufa TaxID=137080 RepID=UPI003CCECD0B